MDADFYIELSVPQGIFALEPFLNEFPFAVAIGKHDQNEDIVLVQSKASAVAGFYYEGCKGDVQFYGASVSRSHPGEPEEVMKSLSRAFQRANLSHRIARIIHELNEDKEVASFFAPEASDEPAT
jgi:hypothetical protein